MPFPISGKPHSKEVCVAYTTSLLVRAVVEPLGQHEPAANKWWTYEDALATQTLGTNCCQVVPRARISMGAPAPVPASALSLPDRDLQWVETQFRRAKLSYTTLSDGIGFGKELLLASVCTESADAMGSRMEKSDAAGNGYDEVLGDSGALNQCLAHLFWLSEKPIAGDMKHEICSRAVRSRRMIVTQYEESCTHASVFRELHDASTTMAACIWFSIGLPLDQAPWNLCVLRRGKALKRMYALRECCREELFVEPLIATMPNQDCWNDATWNSLLEALRRSLPVTNMPMERLIKECKEAAGKVPMVETLAYSGLLAQLWHRHVGLGGENPFAEKPEDLMRAGVPTAATRRTKRMCVRPDVSYKNVQRSAGQSWAQATASWAGMTNEQQQSSVPMRVQDEQPRCEDCEGDVIPDSRPDTQNWKYSTDMWPLDPAIVRTWQGSASGTYPLIIYTQLYSASGSPSGCCPLVKVL